LEVNPASDAMLLEWLNPGRSLNDVELEEAVTVAGRLLRRLSVPAPSGLPRLQSVAERLSETMPQCWKQLGQPFPKRLLDRACDLTLQLGPSAAGLLVNYDLHYADVLAGTREPWLTVDPKAVVGDPEYGIAQLLWRRLEEMEAQGGLDRYFQMLAEAAGLVPDLARSWTLVRCVDYWLWGLGIGLTEDPARCQILTDWIVG
jgi:streptomycin 6-kinase